MDPTISVPVADPLPASLRFSALFRRPGFLVALIVLAYSISLFVLASALFQQYGFPLDDSYILQTVARNFAHYGVLGFIPGVPSSGATSVLWACIQAASHRFTDVDPVLFNLALSWLLLASIGSTLFLLARRDGFPLSLSFFLAVSPALCGNFIWLGLIGMEHLLFIAILLATIYFWFDVGRHRLRSALLAGIGIGLLAITRPEAMVLGPLIVATAWAIKRSTREAISALAAWTVFVGITIGTNLYTSHSWMPATLQGRTWLYFRAKGGPHSLFSIEYFLFTWLLRPSMQFSLWIAGPDLPSYQAILLTCIPILIASAGAIWIFKQRPPRIIFLFFLALAHFAIYLFTFPTMGHGGRYQPLNLFLLLPCFFAGVLFLSHRARKLHPQTSIAVATAALVVAGAMSLRVWRTVAIDGIGHINDTHGKAVQWVLQNEPATARIAALDIGKISYALNRPLSISAALPILPIFPISSANAPRFTWRANTSIWSFFPAVHWPADSVFRNPNSRDQKWPNSVVRLYRGMSDTHIRPMPSHARSYIDFIEGRYFHFDLCDVFHRSGPVPVAAETDPRQRYNQTNLGNQAPPSFSSRRPRLKPLL